MTQRDTAPNHLSSLSPPTLQMPFLCLSPPTRTLCLPNPILAIFPILLSFFTHSYLHLSVSIRLSSVSTSLHHLSLILTFLSYHHMHFHSSVCSSQSPNSFSLLLLPSGVQRWSLCAECCWCQGCRTGAQTERAPLLWHDGWVNKRTRGPCHIVAHTPTLADIHTHIHRSHAHSQISIISVQRSGSAEWSLGWLGRTHKAALQWWSDTHTHLRAHMLLEQKVCHHSVTLVYAAGALCINRYRPRSHWGIIWEPLPSPHTHSLTHMQTLCIQWGFKSPTTP